VVIDAHLFTGFRRGDPASFGPADVTEEVQEQKRLEKGDETIEVTFPMLDVLR
jgi:hypothetical protein